MKIRFSTACGIVACLSVLLPSAVFAYEVPLEDTSAQPAAGFKLPFTFKPQDSYAVEIAAALFCAGFLVNMYLGRRKNEKLAVRYVAELVRSDTALHAHRLLLLRPLLLMNNLFLMSLVH